MARVLWLAAAALAILGPASPIESAELEFKHINDLAASRDNPDERYTGTATLAGTFRGWTIDLTEYVFTDRDLNEIRFDETYLTVARDFIPGSEHWRLRWQAGLVHVGKGLIGQRGQNNLHRILGQDEVDLDYIDDGTHLFVAFRAARPVVRREGFALTPYVELESAGFKKHALAAITADWDVGRDFGLLAETGYRATRTHLAALAVFLDENAPTVAFGARYKRWLELRWTLNYFGVGDRHWHLYVRVPVR